MQFEVKKFLNQPQSFCTYTTEQLCGVLLVNGYSDDITRTSSVVVQRSISWSEDEHIWTPYIPITHTFSIPATKRLYIKVMWKVVDNPFFEYIDINSFRLNIEFEAKPKDPATDFVQKQSFMDKLSITIGKFETKMNTWMNDFAGIPVMYYRTLPDQNTKDVMLNEYSIHNVVECKEINVVAENLPDLIPAFNDYSAISLEKFEIFIDYQYFKKAFGKDAKPRIEDRIFLKIYNILYYVHSAYLMNGVRERSLTWVLSLLVHDETQNLQTDSHLNQFKDMTLTKEDLFADVMFAEMENAANTDQTRKTKKTDLHTFISDLVSFIPEKITSNGHIVASNFYRVKKGTFMRDGVSHPVTSPNIGYRKYDTVAGVYGISMLFRYKEGVDCELLKNDTYGISIVAGRIVVKGVTMTGGPLLDPDVWYGMVINVYDTNCEVSIWKFKSTFRTREDTSMEMVTTQFLTVKKFFMNKVVVGVGEFDMSNLRIWKIPVPTEYQSFVLTSAFVEKPEKCYLIDNCDPEVRLFNYSQDITQ